MIPLSYNSDYHLFFTLFWFWFLFSWETSPKNSKLIPISLPHTYTHKSINRGHVFVVSDCYYSLVLARTCSKLAKLIFFTKFLFSLSLYLWCYSSPAGCENKLLLLATHILKELEKEREREIDTRHVSSFCFV